MREPADPHSRSTPNTRKLGHDEGRERKAALERSEAHRRWIGGDDDGACRGID